MLHKTTNYSLFQSFTANREVNPNHVNQLVRAIEKNNFLHLNPIIVDNDMRVIDGQHRLDAAAKLGVEIYYLIDENVKDTDISTLNSKKLAWKNIDYINFWTIKNRKGFDVLSKYVFANQGLPISTIVKLLGGGTTKELAEGYCDVSREPTAKAVIEILNDYSNYCKFWNNGKFVLAILTAYSTGKYDHNKMKEKLEYQRRSLVLCISTKQYLEMIEEIYNYKSSISRVKFV